MADFIHERQASIANRFSIVRDAISRLDDRHDKSWDDDGLPSLGAVSAMTSFEVSREELNKFDRRRRVQEPLPGKMNDTDLTPDEAAAAFDEAELALAESRERLRVASLAVRDTRDALGRAESAWKKQFSVTPEENARQYIASQIETRRKIATGEVAPAERPRLADSYIDRSHGLGGTGDDFARRRMRHGSSRGAFPQSSRGFPAPAPKPPSEQ